jgi:para-aminobenzoate synthetase/4-amino-4-deoxychorismate lyase
MRDYINHAVIHDAATRQWLHFLDPCEIIVARSIEAVIPKLKSIEDRVRKQGLYAAGFISYEAAPAFDSALEVKPLDSFPLFWFGLYSKPDLIPLPKHQAQRPCARLLDWSPSVDRDAYDEKIDQVKALIASGDTYQVNYTLRLTSPFSGDPWSLFLELAESQQSEYAAFIDTDRYAICSASPELFFQLRDKKLTCRPMKGTAARGRTLEEDNSRSQWLHHSEKNRAENVMIVDMLRNDMGRVARTGSVQVLSLFDTEKYPTIWQMTSTITAQTEGSLCEVIAALFPCASITGAPKRRTMQIIADLEATPRRVYTGSIGFITPENTAQFNVAIRTVLVDKIEGRAEYGVGGGILWDSVTGDEYEECRIKAEVLTKGHPDFSLLETILWTPEEGYTLMTYHLKRLLDSAEYFNFLCNADRVIHELKSLEHSFQNAVHKVRLLVGRDGTIFCQAEPFPGTNGPKSYRLCLSPFSIDSSNPFLFHKTTYRHVYESAKSACPQFDDVLLWNEKGEITETCIANVVISLDGDLITPPVQCGLLAGTFRAWLLDNKKIREQIIPCDAIKDADHIYLINSVRKWWEASLDRGK